MIYAVFAGLVFSLVGLAVKLLAQDIDVFVVAFFRQLFGLLAISPLLLMRGEVNLKPKRLPLLLLRGVLSLGAMYLTLSAIDLLPLSDAILLSYTRPLFLPLLIWIFMGKRIRRGIWLGLAVGFLGIALILRPDGEIFQWGTLFGLGAGLLGACVFLLLRVLGKSNPPLRIMFYYYVTGIVLAFLPMFFAWERLGVWDWAGLICIGLLGALYQYLLTSAYQKARATLVGSLLYSAVIFGIILDIIFWGKWPDLVALVGIALVILGSIIVILKQKAPIAPGEQAGEVKR